MTEEKLKIIRNEKGQFIKGYNGHPIGWNLLEKSRKKISETLKGRKLSEKTKRKISEALKGRLSGMFGKYHSKETKRKMQLFHLGKKPYKMTDKIKRKMSESKKGLPRSGNPAYWKHSIETKEKMSLLRKGFKHTKESKRKIGDSHRGEKAWNWIKDRNKLKKRNERNDSAYNCWVREVKKRDNNQCLFKGQDCSGYNIVHHILPWSDYPELRYELKNGITLCQFHHPRKRVEEQRLIPFFQEMIMSKELI